MVRKLLMVVLLVLVILATAWVVQRYRKPGSTTVIESQAMDMSTMKAPPGTMPVTVAKAQQTMFLPLQTYTGSVRAWSDEDVVARVTGQVLRTLVYPGQRVYPGQLIVELDADELRSRQVEAARQAQTSEAKRLSSKAALERSKAQIEVARRDIGLSQIEERDARAEETSAHANLVYRNAELSRERYLYGQDAVSLEELQKTRAETEEARTQHHHRVLGMQKAVLRTSQARLTVSAQAAAVAEARAELAVQAATAEQQQAAARTAQVILGYTQIRARSAGVVTERPVSPGTLVMPGTVLLRIKQTDQLRLQAQVPAELSAQLQPGMPVRYRLHAEGPSKAARVSSVFREADVNSRTVTVEAVVRDARLIPGDFVELSLSTQPEKRRLTVPLAAIQRDLDDHTYVWKVVSRKIEGKAVYTCVMHPEVLSDHPGQCPKCGMDLVLKSGAEPSDKPDYTCVMHPQVSQDKPGQCPICGMDLVPRERKGDWTVARQPVELDQSSGAKVAIRKGLVAGDEVVVRGATNLREGMAISKESEQP